MKLKKLIPVIDLSQVVMCEYYKHTFRLNPRTNDYNFFLNRHVKKLRSYNDSLLIILEDK